jgi:branched-subunit amino acid permease
MPGNIDRELGALGARMETLEKQVEKHGAILTEVRDAVVGAKGGWVVLVAVGAFSSGVVALVLKLFPWLLR